jgi:hypothetical protein
MSDKRSAFPETMKDDWLTAATKELGGDNPLAKLSFQAGEQTLLPYYDASDIAGSSTKESIAGGRKWINAPSIAVTDAIAANTEALLHLREGADGLLFNIQDGDANVADLFSGIELPFCSIYFCGNVTTAFLGRFERYASGKYDGNSITGAAYGLSASALVSLKTKFKALDQFSIFGLFHDKPALDITALSILLKEFQERFEMTSQNVPHLPHAALLLTISDDLFGEMIRIHAISMLWNCFREAYKDDKTTLRIHVWSRSINDAFEPQGNMISSVARAISGVIAGADVLTVDPQSNEPLQSQTARNVSFILHEESQLAKASHMLAGAYFIEAEAKKLAEETWRKFQALVRK